MQLGDFVFSGVEVPENISVGGTQMLAVHQMIGGAREIQAMGPVPAPLSFSGWMVGEKALDRAQYLHSLRASGLELDFTFGQLAYRVVIADFRFNFQRSYQLTYSITLEVVADSSLNNGIPAYPSVNDVVNDDTNTATTLSNSIGDSGLSSLIATVKSATAAISDFAKATSAEISSVLTPVAEARAAVGDLLATANNTIQSVTTVGGVLPNNPVAQNAARMMDQVNAMNSAPQLLQLDSVLGRIQANVSNANTGTKTTTMAGGNLMSLAATSYGDPMAWTTIARANNINDPSLSGINTLAIPPKPDGSGGVLNA